MRKLIIIIPIILLFICGCTSKRDPGQYELNYKELLDLYIIDEGGWANFNDTDEVLLSDHVYALDYIASKRVTKISFKSSPNANPVYLGQSISFKPDNGDLTPRYKVGNIIDFKLHIINVDDTQYETIKEWTSD